jgi:undecaprenyl diphosphate synthase
VRRIEEAEALTAKNTRMTLYIAFNYGARQELLDAAGGLAAEWATAARAGGEAGGAMAATGAAAAAGAGAGAAPAAPAPAFTAEDLRRHLYAPEMHDPELLIRTSGELRLSNFLLWQCAYAELYFSDALWPDFGERELDEALADYARRQRRFGGREPAGAAGGGAPESSAAGGDRPEAPAAGAAAPSADRQSAAHPRDGGGDA